MLRRTLAAASALLVADVAFAQQALEASRVYPLTSQPKAAGTINLNTGRWISPSQVGAHNAVIQKIYDNRCTSPGAAIYTGAGSCETYIDEGEIPGPDNLRFAAAGGLGAMTSNNVVLFQFGYCTALSAVTDLRIGFYSSLGGDCAGIISRGRGGAPMGAGQTSLASRACFAAVTTSGLNPQGTAYYDVAQLGLPASTGGGPFVSCWIVNAYLGNTGFCLQSEGDGVWNNSSALDDFNWSFEMNDPSQGAGLPPNGVVISGNPSAGAFGSCTYNLACGTQPNGTQCGTGLGTLDAFWNNVDGDVANDTTNTGVACISAPSTGTNCAWFGGYPGNPYGSFWMAMLANGGCTGLAPAVTNCQILPTVTQGCQSVASTVGLPSASSAQPFTIRFTGLISNVNGVVFYGLSGPVSVAWSPQSNLCVKSPTQRMNGVPGAFGSTGGTTTNCTGSYSFDFNAVLQGSMPGMLGTPMSAGQRVDVQGWQRDAPSTKHTNLTDALSFVVGI